MLLRQKISKEKILEYLVKESNNIQNGLYNIEHISLPTKLEKEDYSANLPKVRGTKFAYKKLNLRFRAGSKFWLLYIKDKESDCICYEHYEQIKPFNFKIDWERMLDLNIFMKLKTIFEVIGWGKDLKKLRTKTLLQLIGQKQLVEVLI